jgi:hypothetical protein
LLDVISGNLQRGNVVFFLGAGCSAEPPSRFPVARELALRIAYEDVGRSPSLVKKKYGSSDPSLELVAETLFGQHGGMHRFKDLLLQAVRDEMLNAPNSAHHALAHMAAEGFVSEVISSNIDKYMDTALAEAGITSRPIRHAGEMGYSAAGPVHHYKVHGDLDVDAELLLVTKGQLARGLQWVQRALSHLTQMHCVVFVGYSGAADYVNETVGMVLENLGRRSCYLVGREPWEETVNLAPTNRLIELCRITRETYDDRGAGEVLEDLLHRTLLREWQEQLKDLEEHADLRWGSALPRDELSTHVEFLRQQVDDLPLRPLQDMAWLLLLLRTEAKYVDVRRNSESLRRALVWRLRVAIETKSYGVPAQPAFLRTADNRILLVVDAHDFGLEAIMSRVGLLFGDDRRRMALLRLGVDDSTTVMFTGEGEQGDIDTWDVLHGFPRQSQLLRLPQPKLCYAIREIDAKNVVAGRKADGSG